MKKSIVVVILLIGTIALAQEQTWKAKSSEIEALNALMKEANALNEREQILKKERASLNARFEAINAEIIERCKIAPVDVPRLSFKDGVFFLGSATK